MFPFAASENGAVWMNSLIIHSLWHLFASILFTNANEAVGSEWQIQDSLQVITYRRKSGSFQTGQTSHCSSTLGYRVVNE